MFQQRSSYLEKTAWSTTLCLLLGFFYTNIVKDWRFFDDDYGAIYLASKAKTLDDVKTFFGSNHNDKTIMPTNFLEKNKDSFSTTSFRPLTLVYYFIVNLFLDPNHPQNYFNLSIALHIIVCLFLFFAFNNYLSCKLAFCAALLFGMYPFSGKFLGRFVIQPYSLIMIFNLLAYFFVFWGIAKKSDLLKLFGAILFGLSLFFHEASISFLALCFFMISSSIWAEDSNFFDKTSSLFISIFPFLSLMFFYFLFKYYSYPNLDIDLATTSFFHKLKYRFFDFVTLAIDAAGYSFIAPGNRILKSVLLALDATLLVGLLIFGFNLFSTTLLLLFAIQAWPSIIIMHVSRYLYFALPFLLLSIFYFYQTISRSRDDSYYFKKLLCLFLELKYFIILFFGFFTIQKDLLYLEKKFCFTDDRIREFSKKLIAENNSEDLCFAGLPFDFFPVSGLAQSIWFYTNNNKRRIFYDPLHTIRFHKLDFLPKNNFAEIKYIESINNDSYDQLSISLDNNSSAHILIKNPFGVKVNYSMGQIDYELADGEKTKAKKINILFSNNFNKFKIATWDQEMSLIKILP